MEKSSSSIRSEIRTGRQREKGREKRVDKEKKKEGDRA